MVTPDTTLHDMEDMHLPNQGARVFDNVLYSQSSGATESNPSGGSRITKINGCLERCKERPKLLIPYEMIAEDVEYYTKHSLYCKFLGLRVSLQFLEN